MIKIPPVSPESDNIFQQTWFLEQVRRAIKELQDLSDEPWTYIHLPADFSNSTDTLEDVPTLSFSGEVNTKYEVEVLGAFQTSNSPPELSLNLTIPSGELAGITHTQ